MKKRVVSLLLCLIMALSLIPTTAFAVGTSSQDDGISLTSIVKPDGQSYYTYEFYLSSDSSEPYSTQIVKEGEKLYQPETPTTPEGKVFTGWYDEKGNLFTGFGKVDEITESDTIELYAGIEDGYYVFFMNNDTVIATKTGTTGTEISLNSVSFPVKADQAITGWYYDVNRTQPAGESVTIRTSNISLYAKVENGHWITFDSDGGSYVEPKFFKTSKDTEKPTDPTKPGYDFAGWNTEDDTAYTFGNLLTANITLKAQWTEQNGVPYTVIHWQENANDDGYSFAESVQLTGTPGQLTEDAVDKSYEGFTLNQDKTDEQKTIAGNGSTIVNVYYKRNVYKVIFATNSDNGPDPLCGKEEHEHTYTKRKGNWWNGYKYKGGCYPQDTFSNSRICGKDEHTHTHGGLFQDSCYGTIYKELTIEAKYGASIGNKWPTKNGSSTWAVERNGNTYQANIDTMPLGGATFYGPKAGKNSETAYYYVEVLPGETGTVGPNKEYKQHHIDTTPGRNLEVTKEDRYDITGFKLNDSLSTSIGAKYNGAKFYYTRNSYKIVFMNNGQEKTVSRKYEQSIANDSYTPTAPEGKEGYKFAGWYDNELCEGKEYTFTGKTMPAQNITLYAKWVAPVHTVTLYKTDKTTVYYKFENVSHNNTIDVTKIPTYDVPDGYKFLGWVKEDGSPFNFSTQITRNYNLYAKIGSTATYTVTYDANGGDGAMADNTEYAEGAIASVKANSFTAPKGQVFLGWSTTASGPVEYYANSQLKIEKQNVTLYAIWGYKDSTVTLTYNANYEGANPATETFPNLINNGLVTLAAATLFTRTGYQFTGWNTQANGKGVAFKAGDEARVDSDEPNVLYAQWKQLTGSITVEKTVNDPDNVAPTSFTIRVTGPGTGTDAETRTMTVAAGDKVTFDSLPFGEYTITEADAKAMQGGYTWTNAISSENVTIGANNLSATVTVTNTYAKNTAADTNIVSDSLTIRKVDSETKNVLDGAKFELRDGNGNTVGTFDRNTITGIDQAGTFYLYETTAPTGYKLPDTYVATVTVEETTSGPEWNGSAWVTTKTYTVTSVTATKDGDAYQIENTRATGILTINKVVEGVTLDADKDFRFQLYTMNGTEYVPYDIVEVTVKAGETSGANSFLLPTDMYFVQEVADSAAIENYSVTTTYERVDGPVPVYSTAGTDGIAAVVTESGNTTVKVTNRYNQITGTLTISKELVGLNATDFEEGFAFEIKDASGKVVATVEKVFPDMTTPATVTLVPGTYTIVEKSANKDGYDLTTEYDKETFTVEAGKNVIVTVTNTYTKKVTPPPAEYTLSVDIQKNIELKRSSSRKPGKASFTFEAYLVDEKGNETILDTVTIDTKGTKSADGTLTFTLTEDDLSVTGHGTVYVREVKGSTRGWTYDDTVYALGVELTTDGKLNIISVDTKRIDKPATLEFTNVYYKRSTTTGGGDKPIQSVKTGDMGIAMYAMTSLLSLGGAALVIKKRKEEK